MSVLVNLLWDHAVSTLGFLSRQRSLDLVLRGASPSTDLPEPDGRAQRPAVRLFATSPNCPFPFL
jgi:hypothetical protein